MSSESTTRQIRRVEGIVSVVVVQVGWFACVLGAARGLSWLGPAVVLVFSALHCAYSFTWRRDLRLMLTLAIAGTILDSLLANLGLMAFYGRPDPWPAWLVPPWITALWLHFGTLRHALFRPLSKRSWIAALCGAVGAPVAYAGGVRLQAASFHPQLWPSLLALALAWAVLLPVASRLTWRGTAGHH